ncbi:interferon-induced protein with tetratricopeptide repeats 5-like [Amphiura filiformis]|uniref:interferon-induced protein with tetratricopeptide repeats 5-like n=1 Tax=Amphiura filiformis TaxID=82378 RepID=UPI003B2159C0
MALPDFLTDVPSHFNWGIDIGTIKEFDALKLQLDEHLAHNPGVMTIQALLFQSFIYVSKYKDPKPNYVKGREYLNKAYDEIKGVPNEEEKQGYLIVVKCNEAFMAHTLREETTTCTLAAEIQKLLSEKTDLAQACISSVRAFALSRVGMSKYDEAKIYFQKALDVQPNNTQWLFGLALVTGRCSRNRDGFEYSNNKEQERDLYKKILTIDENHALAHVFLAFNLSFKGDHAAAMRHASKSRELAPRHPHLLVKASKVFRKAGFYKAALPILQDACGIGQNSAMFHEMGLAYRDMYNDQNSKKKEAIKEKKHFDRPDKDLLRKAIEYFTKALEANATNNMALKDRALTYERLHMIKEADDDFTSLLTVRNTEFSDQVQFNTSYALFLQRTCNNEEKACERYRIAIDCAAKNCVTHPVTRENPKPVFDGVLKKDLYTAKKGYMNAMEKRARSADPETHSQGLKGLAWLDQVYGEHDSARAKYEEYLDCDENRNDSDAIH